MNASSTERILMKLSLVACPRLTAQNNRWRGSCINFPSGCEYSVAVYVSGKDRGLKGSMLSNQGGHAGEHADNLHERLSLLQQAWLVGSQMPLAAGVRDAV